VATNARTEQEPVAVTGDIEDLELAIDSRHRSLSSDDLPRELEFLELDLSNCRFLQLATMMWIVAFLNARERKSLRTRIRLPADKKVRDFMSVWEFPRAVRDAVGRPYEDFLGGRDVGLFVEEQALGINKLNYAGKVLKIEGIEQRLLSEGFFELNTFVPQKMANPDRLATQENARWRQDRILSVLSRQLGAPSTTVSSHIVHEAVMNSLRHPQCRLIQTASYFDRPDTYLLSKRKGIVDWRHFFYTLRHDRTFGLTTPGTRVWELLPEETRAQLTQAHNGIPNREDTEARILDGLNEVLSSDNFYDEGYFHKVAIPDDIRTLLARHPRALSPQLLQKRNRQLLEAAFPEDVFPLGMGHLTIAFWDDGDSMVDTLLDAIKSQKPVRSVAAPELYTDYEVTIEDQEGHKSEPAVVRSDLVPNINTSEELVLLAATFPGITRDVTGEGHAVDPSVAKIDPRLGYPGMGLYVLTNQVVEVYGGSVSIRTKNYFLNVKGCPGDKSPGNGFRYAAKVRRYGEWYPAFQGNMLTIRLPLR
jgi:hypothetical protein